jgi:iron-sulfur cluster assembly protein
MSDETLITMTGAAIEKVKELLGQEEAGKGLRLGVKGGGCSGFSYSLTFDFEKDRDNIIEATGFKIYLDPKSTIYLKGIQLDHQGGLDGKGFVFENPNATNTCGCGESFSI